jgi:hypothetical protein
VNLFEITMAQVEQIPSAAGEGGSGDEENGQTQEEIGIAGESSNKPARRDEDRERERAAEAGQLEAEEARRVGGPGESAGGRGGQIENDFDSFPENSRDREEERVAGPASRMGDDFDESTEAMTTAPLADGLERGEQDAQNMDELGNAARAGELRSEADLRCGDQSEPSAIEPRPVQNGKSSLGNGFEIMERGDGAPTAWVERGLGGSLELNLDPGDSDLDDFDL